MSQEQRLAQQSSHVLRGGIWLGVILVVWMLAMAGFKSVQCRRLADFLHVSPQQVRPANDHPLLYARCFSLQDKDGARIGYVTTDGPFAPRFIGFYPPYGPTVECNDHRRALVEQGRAVVAEYERKSPDQINSVDVHESPSCSRAVIACNPASSGMYYEIVVNTTSGRIVSIRRKHVD